MKIVLQLRSFYESKRDLYNLVFVFILVVFCYGLLIPFLGFYWDDLPYLYQLSAFGTGGFPEYVASDRPFSAWIFIVTTWLFRFNPLGYHLLALLLRFAGCILFYAILKKLWPDKPNFQLFSTIIFAVYPGFLQQPIALIYNHHLSILCLFLGSLLLMLKYADSDKKNPLVLGFSVLMAFQMFSIENFALLELVRPILLWIVLSRKKLERKEKTKQVLLIWLPYLAVFLVFIIWRVFIFQFPTYQPGLLQALADQPLSALSTLLQRTPRDFFTATAGAWLYSFSVPSISAFGTGATYLLWILVAGIFIFSMLFFLIMAIRKPSGEKSYTAIPITGAVLFILGAALIWVLELPLEIVFAWDRLTIGLIPGVAILFGWLIDLIARKSRLTSVILLSLLTAFAVGSHFENNIRFKRDWENLQNLFTQLSWRIPALADHAALLTSDPGVIYYSDNSLTSPLNLTYSNNIHSHDLGHFFFYTDVRLGRALPELSKGIPITQGYRSFIFNGNTSDMIAMQFDPPACVKVMDRVYSNSITNLNLTELQTRELRLTDLNLIDPKPQHFPPTFIVKYPDKKDWCYYFEKADLARQIRDYEEIAILGDQARNANLSPRKADEWLPFLEGYSWLGRWDEVSQVLDEIFTINPDYASGVCYTLRRIKNTEGFAYPEKLSNLLNVYNCP